MLRCYGRRISSAYRKPHTCGQHHAAFNGRVIYGEPVRTTARRTRIRRIRFVGLLVVVILLALLPVIDDRWMVVVVPVVAMVTFAAAWWLTTTYVEPGERAR